MKTIVKEKGNRTIRIETPWLSREDAAEYLGISSSMFGQLACQIEHGMHGRVKQYHVDVLDRFAREYQTLIKETDDDPGGECTDIGDSGRQ